MQSTPSIRIDRLWESQRNPSRRIAEGEIRAAASADRDTHFVYMLQSFKRSGGLSQAQDVADLMASRHGQDVGTLAKWIVKGDLVHFDWRHETWLPMFQFDLSTMTPSTNVGRVLREFAGVLDAWEIAHWFARPCVALEGRTPAESLATDPDGVLQAARCDRFLIDA